MVTDQCTATVEVWKPVVGYEGRYSVSSLGRVRSELGTNKPKGHILLTKDAKGYRQLSLYKDNDKGQLRCTHRLVCLAFVPNPEGKPQVNHKNGIKTDNRAENLEWVTIAENFHHALDVLGNRPSAAKLSDDQIREIRARRAGGQSFGSLGREYGVTRVAIAKIVKRITWAKVV